MVTELLREIVSALEQRNIPYMISGSVAMNAYTIPRMTRDIDIVIELAHAQLDSFASIFDKNFYFHRPSVEEEIKRRGIFNVIDNRSGYKIDFVLRKNSIYRKLEFERKVRSGAMGIDAWIVTLEDLIISKLVWIQEVQNEKQMDDIRNLLDRHDIDSKYLKKWIQELKLKTFNLNVL